MSKKQIFLLVSCLMMVASAIAVPSKKFLIFGASTGWIGGKIALLLKHDGHEAFCAISRLENREQIAQEIDEIRPDFIINAAGMTGRPNVDWCENNRQETVRINLLGTLNLIDLAYLKNIPVTNISTGCIYSYDEQHPMRSGIGFTEEDEPNCTGSFYAKTKVLLEKLIADYPNVLHLRVKMPISSDMHARSFIGRIIAFKKVVNIPNSLCNLDELLPVAIEMTLRGLRGFYNFTNPGTLSHHEVLELYKEIVNPAFTYEGCTPEEEARFSRNRSNAELDVTKLVSQFPHIKPIQESIIILLQTYKKMIYDIKK